MSVRVHNSLSLFSLCLLLFLCSFCHHIHTALLFVLSIPRFSFLFISLSQSLIPCLTPSLYPSHSRHRATSVELIRYSGHIWTALTGINHEYFEVPMQRFFRLLVVSSAEPAHGVLLFYLRFHAKSLSLTLPCKVSTSASTGFLTLSTCAFHRKPTQQELIRTHPPNLAWLSSAHSQPERWLLLEETATLPLLGEVVSIPVVWSFHPIPCFCTLHTGQLVGMTTTCLYGNRLASSSIPGCLDM